MCIWRRSPKGKTAVTFPQNCCGAHCSSFGCGNGLDVKNPRDANQKYVEDLRNELQQSLYVGKVVLLGMDGVYDSSGKLDQSATEWLVGNESVLQRAEQSPIRFWLVCPSIRNDVMRSRNGTDVSTEGRRWAKFFRMFSNLIRPTHPTPPFIGRWPNGGCLC